MPNASTEFGADGARIAIVPVGGHLVPRHDRHRFDRSEKCFGGGHVAVLDEHHVEQSTQAVGGAVEVASMTGHLDVGLINVPAAAELAAATPAEILARAGVSLLSQARTASWLNTMPRTANISSRSRNPSL